MLHEQQRNIYSKTLPQQQKDGVILWRMVSGLAIDRRSYRGMSYSATRSSLSSNMSRIWRFNRKRKIAQSPYCTSEAWTEWELALWTKVVPICNKTGNVGINVTLRSARITTVAVEKQSEYVFAALVFIIQSACTVSYCRLRPVVFTIFFNITSRKALISRKKLQNTKYFDVLYNFFWKNISHSWKNQWDFVMKVHVSSCEDSVIPCHILTLYLLTWRIWWAPNKARKRQMKFNSAFKGLTKLWLPRRIFEKYSNIHFHENLSVGVELFHLDGRTYMTKLGVAFRNSAKCLEKGQLSVAQSGRKILFYKQGSCTFHART